MALLTTVLKAQNYAALLNLFAQIDAENGIRRAQPDTVTASSTIIEPNDPSHGRETKQLSRRKKKNEPMSPGNPALEEQIDKTLQARGMFGDLLKYVKMNTHVEELVTGEHTWLRGLCAQIEDRESDRHVLLEKLAEQARLIQELEDPESRSQKAILWGSLMSFAYARGHISADESRDLMRENHNLRSIYEQETRSTSAPSDWQ